MEGSSGVPARGGKETDVPKKMHDALNRQAKKKGLTGKAKDRYVYGTMNKKGKT